MWAWIIENSGVVSALSSFAMLGVWVLYLQLFYSSYRHRLRPKILITRGGGHAITSRCILTNMSPEIVFIQAVVLRLTFPDRVVVCSLSDIDRVSRQDRDPRSELFQGPLSSGEYLDLGTFEELVTAAMHHDGPKALIDGLQHLSVTAVGIYTWHDQLAAAERSFAVRAKGKQKLLDAELVTARQIRSRREKKRITRILEEQAGNTATDGTRKSVRIE
ncbi:hypothetical protein ABID21_000051 [Pseudorhizobium tarimense]|uniref:Uncharacterized protein n=1 Tax=Pseudorhizobium tarimense TaxID=1079109 RepID=A0ABV2H0I2_9HYPH|nr:hypothetical protein [Pseudorhizobium tarimense]MCJ8517309.1 hypothetical protein [Pseudorhizobium tarimense]